MSIDQLRSALDTLEPWLVVFIPAPSELPGILFELLRYALFFSVVYIALKVIRKLPTIHEIIIGFNKSRGPIWDMRNTVDDFKTTIADLRKFESVIKMLRDQMSLLDEKIDAAQKQVEALQQHSASERTDESPAPLSGATTPARAQKDEQNWQKLREIWRAHVGRLEALVDSITDGRRARPYRRMTRYDYRPIIDRLEIDDLLSPSTAKASRDLMDIFNTYRPRNREVPDKVVGDLIVLDHLLGSEVVLPSHAPQPYGEDASSAEVELAAASNTSSSLPH